MTNDDDATRKTRTPRRPRGAGTVYRRTDGRWVGRLPHRGSRRYYYGRTKREAEQKLIIARCITEQWGKPPDLSATVTTVLDSYRMWVERPHAKKVPPALVPGYLELIEHRIGDLPVAFLTIDQLREQFYGPLAEELDDRAFEEARLTLIDVLDYARCGFVTHNVAIFHDALPDCKQTGYGR